MPETVGTPLLWGAFTLFILALLALDLGLHRRAHVIGTREALGWSVFWITLALAFNVLVYRWFGADRALEFLTGYLIEKALSVDNVFVFLVVFSYFAVPAAYQHRVLFWGVLGAIVFRVTFILAGAALLKAFHWIVYAFGALLVYTGLRLVTQQGEHVHPERNPALRLVRRIFPVTPDYREARFFVRDGSRLLATPLLLVLAVVEATDIVFAVDSIPAIFAVTKDPFIVYTSNIFAILGLRALFFLLAGVITRFHHLKYGLGLVLGFVGVKMLASDVVSVPIGLSLAVVVALIGGSVVASLVWPSERSPETSPEASGASPLTMGPADAED
ncbi:MAG: TerC family protein [Armatimonadota bacterium]|nr:TerC family protein [Armatimonadota bacterium]MDR7422664.1 TerC family protein [Armatimonadota bacterium]MDR7454707.1 TerC family protein [Armatimonadota bacterium]MDR7456903.1 TerC family protein [Armatimonadota bacterium]MDR7496791.1 TerC family protein [Armatimonadota bacterium]